jgi:hypothetical protein
LPEASEGPNSEPVADDEVQLMPCTDDPTADTANFADPAEAEKAVPEALPFVVQFADDDDAPARLAASSATTTSSLVA